MKHEERVDSCLYEKYRFSRDVSEKLGGGYFVGLTKYRNLRRKMVERWGEEDFLILGDTFLGYFIVTRKEHMNAQKDSRKIENS